MPDNNIEPLNLSAMPWTLGLPKCKSMDWFHQNSRNILKTENLRSYPIDSVLNMSCSLLYARNYDESYK